MRARSAGFGLPDLPAGTNSKVADIFRRSSAQRPDCFLVSAESKLLYHGLRGELRRRFVIGQYAGVVRAVKKTRIKLCIDKNGAALSCGSNTFVGETVLGIRR